MPVVYLVEYGSRKSLLGIFSTLKRALDAWASFPKKEGDVIITQVEVDKVG